MPRFLLVLLPLLLAPGSAVADALVLGLEQSIIFQSNVFKSPVAERADGNYEIRPTIRLMRPAGKLAYDVQYEPAFDVYFRTPGIDGTDHFLRGKVDYAPLPLGKAFFAADFAHYRAIRSAGVEGPGGVPDVLLGAPGRVTRAFGDLGYQQELGPISKASGKLGIQSYTYTTSGNVGTLGFDGEGDYLYELRPNVSIGGSLLASTRGFERREEQPASQNLVLNPNLKLVAEPLRSVFVQLSAGPAWISVRQESGRFFDQRFAEVWGRLGPAGALLDAGLRSNGRDADEWTGFVRASVTKEDAWGSARLEFRRWEEASAGIGSTTIRDALTGTLELHPGAWKVRLRANWNQRKALASYRPPLDGLFVNGPRLIGLSLRTPKEVQQLWFDATAARPIWGDRLTGEIGIRYLYQERDPLSGDRRTRFDNFVAGIMVRYEFSALPYYVFGRGPR